MNIHAKFSGDVAEAINEMITRGHAASKTEALRRAVLDYREHHLQREAEEERKFYEALTAESMKRDWDSPEDEEMSKFYLKQVKGGSGASKKK